MDPNHPLLSAALAERYRVLHEIGAGGMATVYLARDLKHDRDVALKVLRPELTAVLGAERFLQEIRITAKLDHPHILTLIDSGATHDVLWYVLPYARGESLRQKLTREGVLGVDEALTIIRRIAGAVDYAHRQGVIHRDIKPENILLFEGEAMLADFGIALALSHAGGARLTETGLLLGTPQYMSPEQAAGDRALDGRTDVYSLAAVLYEMLAGEPPHSGASAQSVIAKLLTEPPIRLRVLREGVPETIEGAVAKALSKQPVDRQASAAHFAASLTTAASDKTMRDGSANRLTAGFSRWQRSAFSATGLLVLVALAALGGQQLMNWRAGPTLPTVSRQVTQTGNEELADLSPDGRFLATVSRDGTRRKLLVQDLLGGDSPRQLVSMDWIGSLRWSPTGTQLAVGGLDSGRVVAYLVPFVGGSIRPLPGLNWEEADRNMTFSWSPDGSRVATAHVEGLIILINVATGDTSSVRVPPGGPVSSGPEWSPNGRLLAFIQSKESPVSYELKTIGVTGQGQQDILEDRAALSSPRWSPAGDALYYLRGGSEQLRIRVASETGVRRGEPLLLRDGMQTFNRLNDARSAEQSVTRAGNRMAYSKGFTYANLWRLTAGSTPQREQLTTGTAAKFGVAVSPDGKWVAFMQLGPAGGDVFKVPIDGGTPQQVTNGGRVVAGFLGTSVAWSPNGTRLAFAVVDEGSPRVATIGANGIGFRLYKRAQLNGVMNHLEWAPGQRILYQRPLTAPRGYTMLDPDTEGEEPLLPYDGTFMSSAHYSPNAARVALAWERPFSADHPRSLQDSAAPNRWSGGPWVFSLRDSSRTFLGEQWDWPIGWSDDGSAVYVIGTPERESVIRRIPVNGGPQRIVLDLERPNAACAPLPGTPVQTFICMIPEFVSDVWIIDNFDAGMRDRR